MADSVCVCAPSRLVISDSMQPHDSIGSNLYAALQVPLSMGIL